MITQSDFKIHKALYHKVSCETLTSLSYRVAIVLFCVTYIPCFGYATMYTYKGNQFVRI